MHSRREFVMLAVGAGALISVDIPTFAQGGTRPVKSATAITQVFGDGARLTAVAVEYDGPVKGESLSPAAFSVEGRTVTGVFTSTSADPADRAETGRFAIIALSPDDANASLARKIDPPQTGSQSGQRGPGKAGDIPAYDTTWPPASASVTQNGPVSLTNGQIVDPGEGIIETTGARNLIVDDFRQLEFSDPATGKLLRYNLFVPKDYDAAKRYPLVLFDGPSIQWTPLLSP